MRIAITADLHLDPNYPERAHALGDILDQIQKDGISDLIIAGDLFDKDGDSSAYDSFRESCRKHSSVRLHVVPGNHDPEKSLKDVSSDLSNLSLYAEPSVEAFEGVDFLFIPYRKGLSMGEELLRLKGDVRDRAWCMIGHGDFIGGPREPNLREKRVYMPLKQADLNDPNLLRVFLGHIHKPTPLDNPLAGKVTYPGSPQGLDILESGPRRFLIYDTEINELSEVKVNSSLFFLNETIVLVPSEGEKESLCTEFENRLKSSKLSDIELASQTQMRIKIEGFSLNKKSLVDFFQHLLSEKGITTYKSEAVNFDDLFTADDPDKESLADEAMRNLESCGWKFGEGEPSLEEARKAILHAIYKT